MRGFRKICYEQFKKDVEDNPALYEFFSLPKRSTQNSAGYDFFSVVDFTLKPGEKRVIPTGVKVFMGTQEMFMICVRSSMGFRYNVRLANQVGIFESDYYENPSTDGHIYVCLQNEGDREYTIKKGDRFCQGIFIPFLISEEEEKIETVRVGGIGSTSKGED